MPPILYFFIGLSLGLLVWAFSRRVPPPEVGAPSPAPPSPGPGEEKDDRDVFIPGRNFDEMLERLGSGESMLNVILNSMGEGVLLLNQADRVVLMNPAAERTLGLSEKDALGRIYLEVIRHPALADLLRASKLKGELTRGELDLSGGEERTFAVSVSAIRSAPAGSFQRPGTPNSASRLEASTQGGTHLGQIMVLSDITSIKRLMRMRTEFVANVSHELKTPLTAILGYVETLLSGAIDDKKNRTQFLGKIADQAQRLHALITDVLELSRIESGAFVTSLEPVDLLESAQQASEVLKAKWEAKSLVLKLEVPAGTWVTAHPQGLFHVLENLLDNAVKYSPAKGAVRLGARPREDGKVEIQVQDEGPGIPKEFHARIFERFFRVEPSRSREMGGTGLGLSIVKHLMEKMGGEVSVQSGEGKGSTFTLVLPAAAD